MTRKNECAVDKCQFSAGKNTQCEKNKRGRGGGGEGGGAMIPTGEIEQ